MNRMHGIIFAYEQRGELRELTERQASRMFGRFPPAARRPQ